MLGIVPGACSSMEEVRPSSSIQKAPRLLLGWMRDCWLGKGGGQQAWIDKKSCHHATVW